MERQFYSHATRVMSGCAALPYKCLSVASMHIVEILFIFRHFTRNNLNCNFKKQITQTRTATKLIWMNESSMTHGYHMQNRVTHKAFRCGKPSVTPIRWKLLRRFQYHRLCQRFDRIQLRSTPGCLRVMYLQSSCDANVFPAEETFNVFAGGFNINFKFN